MSAAAPSPFAALLRRSKFASYDPAIGQVYTTHNGHAFRGDWGFKRPLPNRRRSGFITVRSVDSPEQQTEWNSGESSARWLKRWEELGKKLEVNDVGPWRSRIGAGSWRVDTEFARAEKSPDLLVDPNLFDEGDSFPNPEAMSPKQFQKYLDHLRTQRSEFKKFLKEYSKEREEKRKSGAHQLRSQQNQFLFTGSGDVQMLHSAQAAPDKIVYDFLKRQAEKEIDSPSSTKIKQRPHPLAGLEYTWMSALQAKYLHKPAPGRNIGSNRASSWHRGDRVDKFSLIAVGGVVGNAQVGTHSLVPTDFGTREAPRTDRERGKGMFRMSKVTLVDPPQTVGRTPQKAMDTKLATIDFRVAHSSNLSNPHPLGSPEYVSQANELSQGAGDHPMPTAITNLVRKAKTSLNYEASRQKTKETAPDLLNTLSKMITPKKSS